MPFGRCGIDNAESIDFRNSRSAMLENPGPQEKLVAAVLQTNKKLSTMKTNSKKRKIKRRKRKKKEINQIITKITLPGRI